MVRLLHFSDTHLGHQQYPRTDPATGLNQREVDHYAAFDAVIQHALDTRPDAVVHAGDLFDGVRPSNRALAVALEGFLRLSRAGIPTVVIAGNHEHPKMRETGSPFRLLEHLDGVHPVYKGKRETILLDGLAIHAVPQCPDNAALRAEVAAIPPDPQHHNVLVVHGAVHDLAAFRHAEFNELTLDPAWFDDRFDYVALGHYHSRTELSPKAWYCGAPDRVSIAESGEEKGCLEVDLEPGTVQVRFRPLAGRPYADLPSLQCSGLDAQGVLEAARESLARVPPGAVARLRLMDIDASLRGLLDRRAIQGAAGQALYLDLALHFDDMSLRAAGGVELRGLAEEFEEFAVQHPVEGLDRDRLLVLARDALAEASR